MSICIAGSSTYFTRKQNSDFVFFTNGYRASILIISKQSVQYSSKTCRQMFWVSVYSEKILKKGKIAAGSTQTRVLSLEGSEVNRQSVGCKAVALVFW